MKKAPYMPLWIDHHLADIPHLDAEGHGAYLFLILAMWTAGGKLPADDKVLARIARVTPVRWKKLREIVLKFVQDDGAGSLTHKRVSLEIRQMKAKSRAAKAKADKRWGAQAKPLKDKDFDDAQALPYRYRPKELSQDNSLGGQVRASFEGASEIGHAWPEGREG